MAFRTNVLAQDRGFYFATSGSDNFSGESLEKPFRTIQNAIDAATSLSPPPSNVATANVSASQGGSFTDSFVMAPFVSLQGTDVAIINSDSTSIVMASFVGVSLTTLVNFGAGNTCVEIDGKSLLGFTAGFLGASGAGGIGVNITGAVEDIFCDTSRVRLQGDGSIGYKITSTGTSPIDINVNTVGLEANNSVFVDYAPVSGTTVVNVSAIEMDGVTGTIGFKAISGELVVVAGRMVSETVADISGNAQFSLKCNAMQGDTICAGTSVVNYKSVGFISCDIDVQDTAIFLGDIHFILGDVTVDVGATITLTCSTLIGDLTVDGTADVFIFNHTGALTVTGTLNGIIGGKRFGTYLPQVVLIAESFVNQNPTGLDTPMQVEFGAAQGTVSDPVMIDVAGELTINETGRYRASIFAQYGRTGAGSTSWLFFRGLRNGIQEQVSVLAKLDNANSDLPIQFEVTRKLEAGDVLVFQVIRDSQGNDSGGLLSETPTPVGWMDSPSAHITMIKE